MKKNGPLVLYWSMRYESKHRHLKATYIASNSKVNPLKTIGFKSQLMLSHILLTETFSTNQISFESAECIGVVDRKIYFREAAKDDEILTLSHVNRNGVDYSVDGIFVLEMGDNDLLNFGKIQKIFLKNGSEIYLVMKRYLSSTTSFDDHFHAYKVREMQTCFRKNVMDLPDIHPCLIHKVDDQLYIATKYIL